MPSKHRKKSKSSKKRKHKRSKDKKKDRGSRKGRKHRDRSEKKRRRESKSGKSPKSPKRSKKRKSSKKHRRREEGSKNERKHKESRSRKKAKKEEPLPDMTAAARNENLGNIVLVKNRHLVQQPDSRGVATAMEPSTHTPVASAPGAQRGGPRAGVPPAHKPTPQQFDTPYPGTAYPPAQPAPDVNIPPLEGLEVAGPPATATTTTPASAPSATPTTTATATPATTIATTGPTPTTTTGVAATDVYGTGFTPSPTPSQPQFPSDEVTRKEKMDDKISCDKGTKWKTYMEKTLDGGSEGMVNEFRTIRGFLPPMATRIAFDANPEKNRFEDIVCIDQTRVRLGCGSYIHASWVNITASKKAILTQLPNRESGAEFWQMVLDVDAQAILLLLTHAEFNMFHANGVFPAEQDFLHFEGSHVRVGEFKRVVIDRDWTMHVISVRSGDRRKYVHMHHYSGWTHGKQPVRLVDLWQVQSVFRKYPNPHIYMSLSGCGRAGTYAAFEIAHERLHSDNFHRLIIGDCICRARQGRMHAVQRAIQLQTIHALIMEHIMSSKFAAQLPTKTTQKYEEFMERFNKCAELQEDFQ